ncbi:reverse transcriptase-RNase H-integrase [Lentinula edodes]|uniref:Reverse transcriptase-RNase H-integrase n=1 Tax=Lentinula edodes TaxID=5353 RepID=A0A1Q3EQJ4_LENED|nr:reverse transcriptase-RNase H-integrase [Lentinula edodes]
MNSVNSSTGLSMFELRYGRCPRVIPPLIRDDSIIPPNASEDAIAAREFLTDIDSTVREARDNLTLAKVVQAYQADKDRGPCELFEEGDWVMLSTYHRREIFKKAGEKRAAKFFARFDGPYKIIKAFPATSHYTLDMPNQPNVFPSFYVDQLKRFVPNNPDLFPGRERAIPQPTIVDGYEEFDIDRIMDSRRRGRGWQFLVRWVDQAPSEDRWLPYSALHECAALDDWVRNGGDGPAQLLDSVELN